MDDETRRASTIVALEELKRLLNQLESPELPIRNLIRFGGENGAQYIQRLLITPNLCKEQLRLDGDMLMRLVILTVERGLLRDGRFVSVKQQVGMCLFILAKGASYRDVVDTFKHSLSTISKYFREVLRALVTLSFDIVRPYHELSEVPEKIATNPFYWPFFKDCVGALDGIHIDAVIADRDGIPFRGRKGKKTWNVLACCSFDMLFTCVNVGWEGSAHDSTVLVNSITQSKFNFPHPPKGKYYLVDSGYTNTLKYMSPICKSGIRCHVPEFRCGGEPRGIEEHFNYRHSSLRTTIERTFGKLKARWRILRVMPQMEEEFQLAIIVATFTLHNFISLHEKCLPILMNYPNVQGLADRDIYNKERKKAMDLKRNEIALQIWQSIGMEESRNYQDQQISEEIDEEENVEAYE